MNSKEIIEIKEIVLEAEALSKAPVSAQLTSALRWVERQTHTRTNHAQMLVGKEEGLFLNAFVKCVNAKRVLEIGTFTGYSLICLADAVLHNEGFGVDALEINQELEYIIAEGLQRAKVEEITRVSFGDAKELLQKIATNRTVAQECGCEMYDVVFIDANKREYAEYYNLVFPLVKVGGYILADNVLWYGKAGATAAGDVNHRDKKTAGIIDFNSLVENDTRVSKFLYKIRDGLYIIRKESTRLPSSTSSRCLR